MSEAPLSMTIPMATLAFLCVAGGIYPRLITVFLPYYTEIAVYIPAKVADAMIFTTAAGIIFFIGMKKVFKPRAPKALAQETNNTINEPSDLPAYTPVSMKHFVFARFAKYFNSGFLSKIGIDQKSATNGTNAPAVDSSLAIMAITIAALLLYMTFR